MVRVVGSRRIDLQIDRLYWRAGFGPSAADRSRARRDGVAATRERFLRGGSGLRGSPARVDGHGLQPYDRYGHDVLWWLDRMVRTTAPLAERMAFNLHDHFATSNDKVGDARLMLAQYRVLRRHSLGNFSRLAHAMARDHAMQWWLDTIGSHRSDPNENFARELMELFTLGVGHYTERDVREAARAFTGFDYDWNRRRYRFDPGPPRQRRQDGVRPSRPLRAGRAGRPLPAPSGRTRRSWFASCGGTSSPRRPRPPRCAAWRWPTGARDTSCGRCCG